MARIQSDLIHLIPEGTRSRFEDPDVPEQVACGAFTYPAYATTDAGALTCAACRALVAERSAVSTGDLRATTKARLISTTEAARRLDMSRDTLDAMRKRAPTDLPGAPMMKGTGTKKPRWKWDEARLREWMEAYTEWSVSVEAQGPLARRKPTRPTAPRGAPKEALLTRIKRERGIQ